MIRARFRMQLPPDIWVADVSRAFPDATLRLLTGVPMGERSLELGEISAADPTVVAESLREHPDIVAYDPLYSDSDRVLVKYETTEQGLFSFLGEASLPPEFPLLVEDGEMEFNVTATRAQFEALGDTLDESPLRYDLLSVVHSDSQAGVLTERQRECLAVALRKGYFEVPRDCTLAEVAEELSVDKSTASETLRRGSGRILDWFFVDTSKR